PVDRIRTLATKLKALEDERARRSTEDTLVALRRHLNRPLNMFDRYEAVKLLQSLVRLASNEADDIRLASTPQYWMILTMQLGPVGQPSHLGVPLSRETRPSLAPLALLSMVAKNPALASLRNLRFRDPVDIQAGSLHAHPTVWEELLHGVKYKHADLM
ncbi:unnamed protein product, partial [Porites evermanni]